MLTAVLDRADTALSRYVPEARSRRHGGAPLRGRDGRACAADDDPGQRITWARAAIAFAEPRKRTSPPSPSSWTATWPVDGFRLDQDMRWSDPHQGRGLTTSRHRAAPRGGGRARPVRPRRARRPPRRAPRGPTPATKAPDLGVRPRDRLRLGLPDARRDGRLPVAPPARAPRAVPRGLLRPCARTSTARTTTRSRAPTCAGSCPTAGRSPDVAAQVRALVSRLDDSEVPAQPPAARGRRRPRAGDPGARVRVEPRPRQRPDRLPEALRRGRARPMRGRRGAAAARVRAAGRWRPAVGSALIGRGRMARGQPSGRPRSRAPGGPAGRARGAG